MKQRTAEELREEIARSQSMKKELCVPCAIRLGETMEVKQIANRRGKLTCAECGRRRYGNEYEVAAKAEAGKEIRQ